MRGELRPDEKVRLFDQLVESSPDVIWLFSAEWDELVFLGPGYEELWGQSRDAIVADPTAFLDGVHPDDRSAVESQMERLSAGERVEVEYRVNPEEGYGRWARSYASPVTDDDGEVVRVAGFTRDVTSQVCQRRSLERKNERLEAFAGVVSHDLRNPLTVARGNLERAREERDSEALETVARAHDRMAAMVDDLLTLARYGDAVSDTDPVDVADALGSCWETVDTEGARIDVDPPGVVSADEGRLKQLLENVLRNAVEHGSADSQGGARAGESGDDAGPAVRVEVGPLDDGFYVADDGPGIPAADRAAVFETGYSTDERGTGFGLAIVERIADAHGWRVDVAESERGGARFEFTDVEFVEE